MVECSTFDDYDLVYKLNVIFTLRDAFQITALYRPHYNLSITPLCKLSPRILHSFKHEAHKLITFAWHNNMIISRKQALNHVCMSCTAPVIVTAPGEAWNVTGSQVFLSCEATGIPTPVLTWRKVQNISCFIKITSLLKKRTFKDLCQVSVLYVKLFIMISCISGQNLKWGRGRREIHSQGCVCEYCTAPDMSRMSNSMNNGSLKQ